MYSDFEKYKEIVLAEQKRINTQIPKYLYERSEIVAKQGDILLKKYPKFQTTRNMISCILQNKFLKNCIICGKKIKYDMCVRRNKSLTCGDEKCRIKAIQKTNIEKYGVRCSMNTKEHLTKRLGKKPWNSFVPRKENTKFINHYKKIKKQLDDNHLSGINSINDYKGILHEITKKAIKYNFKCDICGNEFSSALINSEFPYCRKCHPKVVHINHKLYGEFNERTIRTSKEEDELYEFCNSFGYKIERSKRGLFENKNKEVDFYFPELNLAIEYNGLYWHSDEYIDKNEHIRKTEELSKQNIRLIHIFEDEWVFKKSIVKNRLRNLLNKQKYKIYARKCTIKTVSSAETKKFLEKYHIQGNVYSKINLGLFFKNRLVAIMSFSKSRFNKKFNWELVRYATIGHFSIVGGASKLFSYFIKNHGGTIISYADRRWSNGSLYEKLNFKFLYNSNINYFYTKRYDRYSRIQFQKHKLKDKLKKFNANLSERDNMRLNGFHVIWDCGNKVYVYE